MLNVQSLTNTMSRMTLPQLQQYAALHKDDPYVVTLALSIANQKKQMGVAQAGQAGMTPQPKVVDQDIARIAAPQQSALPEETGIGALPAQNLQGMNMAAGGIVAFGPGGSTGADDVFEKAFKKVLKFEGGAKYIKDDAGKGPTKYGINQTANPDVDVKNLTEDQAREIYRKRYWNAIGGDDLAAKNPQLATIAFDAAVNQGPSTANKMLAASGGEPYKLLALRQQRYLDLVKDNPEKFKKYQSGWTDRVSSLQKDLELDRQKAGLPQLTPSGQALAATGSESTQPELDSSKANVISSGVPALAAAAEAARAGMNMGPLNEVLRPSTRLGIAAPGTVVPAGVGAFGGALSAGAANALSNATPEQLDQLTADIGSDTGFAAGITNAPNRPPEKPSMPYGEQMTNVAKFLVGHPDTRAPSAPAPAEPTPPTGGMPSLNEAFRKFEIAQQNAPEPVDTSKIETPAVAAAPEEKKGGFDWNDFMIKMGLQMMASKDPNAISGVGQSGLNVLAMQQAEAKAKSEAEAKASEAEYRKALGEQAKAMAGAIERGAKEKNLQLEAEKLIAQEISKDKFLNMPGNESMRALRENQMRQTIYRQLGIEPTIAAGAPTGQRLTYNPETGKIS